MNTTPRPVRITRNVSTRHGSLILVAGTTASAVELPEVRAVDGTLLAPATVCVTSSKGYRINVDASAVVWL